MTRIQRAVRLAVAAACATAFGCGTGPHPSEPTRLPADPTPPNLAGDYEITFVAENCGAPPPQPAPPSEFRSRTYAARLEQDGISIRVVMTGVPSIDLKHPALWGQI